MTIRLVRVFLSQEFKGRKPLLVAKKYLHCSRTTLFNNKLPKKSENSFISQACPSDLHICHFSHHRFRTKTAEISIKRHKLFKFFTEIWNISTWQNFLHIYIYIIRDIRDKYEVWFLLSKMFCGKFANLIPDKFHPKGPKMVFVY